VASGILDDSSGSGCVGFAVFVRLQPPTVIRIGANGEAVVVGQPTKGGAASASTGADAFLDQAFVKRFLDSYLNYAPSNVDERGPQAST